DAHHRGGTACPAAPGIAAVARDPGERNVTTDEYLAALGERPLGPGEKEQLEQLERLLSLLERGEVPPWADGSELVKSLSSLHRSAAPIRGGVGLLDDRGSSTGNTVSEALPDPFPGEFRIVRRLGAGNYGQVYLAEEIHLRDRQVALKTLRHSGDL